MNLLPVLPLDGGQIALQLFVQQDPWGGMLQCAVAVGHHRRRDGGVRAGSLKEHVHMLLFASLAVSSYLTLQQVGGGGGAAAVVSRV